MGQLTEYTAAICFYGDELDPDHITRVLGKSPTKSRRKGDVEDGKARQATTGNWILDAPACKTNDLNSQIEEMLRDSTPDTKVWHGISTSYKGRLFCGLFLNSMNEGQSISPHSLSLLAERGLALDLDIYSMHEE